MKKFTTILNEKMEIEKGTIKLSVLFTDIVDSAEKWRDSKEDMMKSLEQQSILFDNLSKKHKGIIVKSIGDAYMVSFKKIEDSIKFAIELQNELKENPIKVNNKNINIRIGICYGEVHETTIELQGHKMIDYMGNVVNSAARIEGKVCKPGNVVFSSFDENIDIKDLLKDYKVDFIKFKNEGDEAKRSSRLLTDVQRYYYKDIKELKGIKEIEVYHINL
ncbi:adenylate/guanylate cyclase domain-containing protein [Trichloromonas sp.]|uniref:adenylate/guanylate cyclase domain-containing protein n=1 Tax=Trichloromonas sp. TaxID=3069249 RepID=UPI002A4D6112|nr:adenylate/guanylate cyclase domain-containing protein [Trichloromonas sp.]